MSAAVETADLRDKIAALRAQDIEGERYLVLDSYDEAEEPYEDEFSQDVAADLYGATQVENE